MKKLALEYLAASYGPEKLNQPEKAEPFVHQMIQIDPRTRQLLRPRQAERGLGPLRGGRGAAAQGARRQAERPGGLDAAGRLLQPGRHSTRPSRCRERATREPNNPEAFYTIATFYENSARKDFRLTPTDKKRYAADGIEAVDKAIELNPDYMEAVTYGHLLLLQPASWKRTPQKQKALLKEADKPCRREPSSSGSRRPPGVGA